MDAYDGPGIKKTQALYYVVFYFIKRGLILNNNAQFKKNVATRSSNLASHQIFYFIRNWKSIHSREKKWHL